MKFEWEEIHHIENKSILDISTRAKVFGGWLVRSIFIIYEAKIPAITTTFISDPNHEWEWRINND